MSDDRLTRPPTDEEVWRGVLTGTNTELQQHRRLWRRIPSDPRCKLCASPFGGFGSMLSRLARHGPMPRNPLMCGWCARELRKHPGGAEVEMSILFADVRDSTTVAQTMSPKAFRDLLQRFYKQASEAITQHDGIVDKYLGDGVMALFIPAFAGEDHAGRAVAAARALIARTDAMPEPRLPIGVGVHTGVAFAGRVGDEGELDFSALGDAVNIAARLGSQAAAHEVLVSATSARAAHIAFDAGAVQPLDLKGRQEPLEVISL